MLFTQDRNKLRELFHSAWQKQEANQALEPLEQIIVNVAVQHPEYHALLAKPYSDVIDQDYIADVTQENPYLHMALHISVHEQVVTDRPAGIQALYYELLEKVQDVHPVEHDIADCLRDSLWSAQQNKSVPNDALYLAELKQRLSRYLTK